MAQTMETAARQARQGATSTGILPPAPRTCTAGPSAVSGELCGQPAVAWFIASGRVYAECVEHSGQTRGADG